MAHVDDGTLNSLLDGELDAARAVEVRAHLASCAECSARFDQAQRFLSEASELLDALVPAPVAVRAPAAAPQPPVTAAPPARRVPKTAREVALNIDGATAKSPAIAPNVRLAREPAPPPFGGPRDRWGQPFDERPTQRVRPRLDWPTLAWAASVVLALGVGYLANEVRHTGQPQVVGEQRMADAAPAAAEAAGGNAAAPTAPAARGSRRPPATPRGKEVRSVAANAPSGKPAAEAVKVLRAAEANAGRLAAGPAPAGGAPAGPIVTAAPAQVSGVTPAAERVADAARQLPAAAAAPNQAAGARDLTRARAAPNAAAEIAPAGGILAAPRGAFRAIDIDEAAARLGGTVRYIEGLALESVKVGPGSLVPDADPTREVVRVVYADPQGRRVQLDQQRLAATPQRAAAALGLAWGDTLATTGPAGELRLRWLDRAGLWVSLTGGQPADTLRGVLGRIR